MDVSLLLFLLSLFIASAFSYILWRVVPAWKTFRDTVEVLKDIGCEKPHWLFGHLRTVQPTEQSYRRYFTLLKKFPKCSPLWIGPFRVYLRGYYPDFMKTILATEEPKDEKGYRFIRHWIGDGLLTSSGAKWKRNRRLLTPAFHFDALKKYLVCTNKAATELVDKWLCKAEDDICVDVFHDVSQMALDSLLRCIISKESGCQRSESNDYLKAVKCITDTVMERVFNPFYGFDFIFNLTSSGRRQKQALKIAHDYTEAAINQRRREIAAENRSETDLDFLDVLLRAKDDNGAGLTHKEICDEVDTFVFEGHDTVSSAISWAFYNLAVHQEIQDRCRSEVLSVLGERRQIEWGDLPKLTYLTMFIKESLRMHSPVISATRMTTKPLTFARGFGPDQFNTSATPSRGTKTSKTFPKGFNFGLCFMLLHHNPNVWNEPEVFDPERFTPENIAKRSPHAYLPFSSGPRNCIGQNFAMNELKVMLALGLAQFKFVIDEAHTKPEMEFLMILRAKNGIHLKLKPI